MVLYRHKVNGTEYVWVEFITGVGLARVKTKAGSVYTVESKSIEKIMSSVARPEAQEGEKHE